MFNSTSPETNNCTQEATSSAFNCGGQLTDYAIVYAQEYHQYCAVVTCVLGIVANSLNIISLTRKHMAAFPINRILASLAYADMLLMIEYIPFICYYKYDSKVKVLPYAGAIFILCHSHITQILHTTSICLTVTLAIWRFLAIKFATRNHLLCSHKRCSIAIASCYILPLFLCIPQYSSLKVLATNRTLENVRYTLYYVTLTDIVGPDDGGSLLKRNFWLYSIFLKLLPCIILIVISIWLITTLFEAKGGRQVQAYGNNLFVISATDENYEKRAFRTTKMLIVILFLFLLTELPQGLFGLFIALYGKKLFITCYQHYGDVMDISALLNGSVTFILYCSMNKMFRISFGQLCKFMCLYRDTGNNRTITTGV